MMNKSHDQKIIESWIDNSEVWSRAVRMQALESRRLVTNDAILNAVLSCAGTHILDVGCGEGWLSHELVKHKKQVTGFDVSLALITQADSGTGPKFHVLSYEEFIMDPAVVGENFDIAVCNFSLLAERVDEMFKAISAITKRSGHLVIQTLHPCSSMENVRYEDGWREETFDGLPGQWSPMPWYFRTLGSWIREQRSAGWMLDKIIEPLHPDTGKPASIIFDLVTEN
jgi:2-polyprenyl-3-methyl-5-hydroxy-6-metoxy-1,4-benzoquinol methylase